MKRMAIALMIATATTVVAPLSVTSAYAATDTQATVVNAVNMRAEPSTSGKIIRLLKKGEQVTVVQKVNSYWYKIQDSQGKTGYVSTSSQYLQVSSGSGASAGTKSASGVVVSGVNLRTSPSTSSSVIRLLPKGETVTILSKVNDYWYQVRDSKGQTGYISTSSKYIQVSGSVPATGGSPTVKPVPGSGGSASAQIEKVIATGMKYLGTPYEYGSNRNNTSTFDCSDLIRHIFLEGIGVKLPADSRSQGSYVKSRGPVKTDWRQLKRGDLLFFTDYKGTKASDYAGIDKSKARISHVAIYLGNGQILHTYSKASGGVRTDSIAGKHWEYRFLFGGSAL
ncbi:SH3 domain-containing protein [Paenibacillus thermoaerophilus]|uniref:SH3 domain-containing protein n=1 Tax=Paenibacillus thermoaerophilus TaxID=1215385 RepID=A0ABW2V1K1_9BACL|nr:SH3 domain-containing C40 family peptidase [Paenibacillus thermoaerophilus]TMV18547.1 NlpC/P60 family protein [Paenibacillus thermoaerophilus]